MDTCVWQSEVHPRRHSAEVPSTFVFLFFFFFLFCLLAFCFALFCLPLACGSQIRLGSQESPNICLLAMNGIISTGQYQTFYMNVGALIHTLLQM